MYPTISDLINDLFGINIPLPIQSFGFFMAISFLIASYLLYLELKRKENEGLIHSFEKKTMIGKPVTAQELILSSLLGFVIGLKLVGAVIDYTAFSENPQTYIFSPQGSMIGGFLLAAIFTFSRYRDKQKHKLEKPKLIDETVHQYQLTGNFVMLAALAGIIGAKIFHNLENIDDFIKNPIEALVSFSGLTFYGGLILAAIALIWYGKKNNIPPLVLCDAAAPSIMIAYAVGRIGCQMAGDGDWGIVNTAAMPDWLSFLPDWLWSYNYPHNVLSEGIPIPGCTGKHCFMLANPVYPTALYETIMCSLLFLGLWLIRKKIKTPGILFSIFLMFNGLERFFIEKIRVNTKYHIFGNAITQAEIISTLLFIAGVILFWYLWKNKNKKISTQST